jgi:hypothetical protein
MAIADSLTNLWKTSYVGFETLPAIVRLVLLRAKQAAWRYRPRKTWPTIHLFTVTIHPRQDPDKWLERLSVLQHLVTPASRRSAAARLIAPYLRSRLGVVSFRTLAPSVVVRNLCHLCHLCPLARPSHLYACT